MGIWQVTFSYETPGDYASNAAKDVYNVIAKTEDEAIAKAYDDFSSIQQFSDLNLSIEGRVETKAKRMTGSRIKFPKLTLQDDQEKYTVSAKLSKGGSSLEYIILEHKKQI